MGKKMTEREKRGGRRSYDRISYDCRQRGKRKPFINSRVKGQATIGAIGLREKKSVDREKNQEGKWGKGGKQPDRVLVGILRTKQSKKEKSKRREKGPKSYGCLHRLGEGGIGGKKGVHLGWRKKGKEGVDCPRNALEGNRKKTRWSVHYPLFRGRGVGKKNFLVKRHKKGGEGGTKVGDK